MSESDESRSGDTLSPPSVADHEIDDPDEYVKTRRLRDLFDARQAVREDRRKAKDIEHFEPDQTEVAALTVYRQSVESYILESKSLLTETDRGTALWGESSFGEVRLELDSRGVEEHGRPEVYDPTAGGWVEVSHGDVPEPTVIEMTGFASLLRIDDPITRTFSYETRDSLGRRDTHRVTAQEQPSWEVLDQMVVSLNDYLSSLGVDLAVEEATTDEWDIQP